MRRVERVDGVVTCAPPLPDLDGANDVDALHRRVRSRLKVVRAVLAENFLRALQEIVHPSGRLGELPMTASSGEEADDPAEPMEDVRDNPRSSTNQDRVQHGRPVAADEEAEKQPDEKAEGGTAPDLWTVVFHGRNVSYERRYRQRAQGITAGERNPVPLDRATQDARKARL